MPQTARPHKATPKTKEKDKGLVTRLTDAGEDTLQRIADLPGGKKALAAFNDLRVRVDDVAKKVRGIDALEARIAKLEKQVAELKPARKAPARRRTTKRAPAGGSTSAGEGAAPTGTV